MPEDRLLQLLKRRTGVGPSSSTRRVRVARYTSSASACRPQRYSASMWRPAAARAVGARRSAPRARPRPRCRDHRRGRPRSGVRGRRGEARRDARPRDATRLLRRRPTVPHLARSPAPRGARPGVVRPLFLERPRSLTGEPLEHVEVERIPLDPDQIPGIAGLDRFPAECLAQLRDVALDHVGRRVGRVIPPHGVDGRDAGTTCPAWRRSTASTARGRAQPPAGRRRGPPGRGRSSAAMSATVPLVGEACRLPQRACSVSSAGAGDARPAAVPGRHLPRSRGAFARHNVTGTNERVPLGRVLDLQRQQLRPRADDTSPCPDLVQAPAPLRPALGEQAARSSPCTGWKTLTFTETRPPAASWAT